MKRLSKPNYDFASAFIACTSNILDDDERNEFTAITADIATSADDYVGRAIAGTTWMIPSLPRGGDPVVFGNIRSSHLKHLYEYYMVKRPEGRKIYDAIMVSAAGSCPMCGGIGRPRTLDHYLPKARYPAFSVLPHNLVPACRDCNTDKGNPVAEKAEDQLIHPYFDKQCFFDEAWIVATVARTPPYLITFEARPSLTWEDLDRRRAIHHFGFFNVAEIYSIRAADEMSVLVDQRRNFMLELNPQEFRAQLQSIGETETLFPNHWRKVMYRGLAQDDWFCSAIL
ncbi:HNH endonuclease [Pseudomonas oryzihabitans]|uniref:HNH endonuclease n=1 Tax=Pseudomonas oryzihabitans TaxID=47885 RepID=UPI002863D881|nr:HNH endonuclease [Pseudomonas psychrotolerans]MDR6679510.1 hypothetical protein [Pseudomonas psychrotolerans]